MLFRSQNNVLIDLFKQLKTIYVDGKPLISNSNLEIATFLKESFTCFEKTKITTIEGVINRNPGMPNGRPRQDKRIELVKPED